jgi:hypothetical protein
MLVLLALAAPSAGGAAQAAALTVTPPANAVVPVGEPASIALGSFADEDGGGPYSIRVEWGDGGESSLTRQAAGAIGTAQHLYANSGTYSVTVHVSDASSLGSGQFEVRAANRPRAEAGSNQMAADGVDVTFEGSGTSELGPIVEYRWRQTSGPPVTIQQNGGRLTVTPGPGTYTFELTVDDGYLSSRPDEVTLWIGNRVPEIAPPGYQVGRAGVERAYELGYLTDPGAGGMPWLVSVDWGDATPRETFDVFAPGKLPARRHVFAASGHYWVVVSARDWLSSAGARVFRIDVVGEPPPPPAGRQAARACVVPRLVGKTLPAVRAALRPRCALGRVGRAYSRRVRRGRVIAQAPRAGRKVARGTRVRVVLSRGRRR